MKKSKMYALPQMMGPGIAGIVPVEIGPPRFNGCAHCALIAHAGLVHHRIARRPQRLHRDLSENELLGGVGAGYRNGRSSPPCVAATPQCAQQDQGAQKVRGDSMARRVCWIGHVGSAS